MVLQKLSAYNGSFAPEVRALESHWNLIANYGSLFTYRVREYADEKSFGDYASRGDRPEVCRGLLVM
jgi:hypothetical protein